MKKIVPILAFTIMLIAACKKDGTRVEHDNPVTDKTYTIENGIITFKTI